MCGMHFLIQALHEDYLRLKKKQIFCLWIDMPCHCSYPLMWHAYLLKVDNYLLQDLFLGMPSGFCYYMGLWAKSLIWALAYGWWALSFEFSSLIINIIGEILRCGISFYQQFDKIRGIDQLPLLPKIINMDQCCLMSLLLYGSKFCLVLVALLIHVASNDPI